MPINVPLFTVNPGKTILPALAGAVVCLFFIKTGFMAPLFLVPLGVVAFRCDYRITWFSVLLAVTGNLVITVVTNISRGGDGSIIFWDILYFSVITSIFTLITAPPPGFLQRLSAGTRLLGGAFFGAILFTLVFIRSLASSGFLSYLNSLLGSFISIYRSSGADVVQNAMLESLTPQVILNLLKSIVLRGGSLVSCVILFSICRAVSIFIARLTARHSGAQINETSSLSAFHVYPNVIWVLSISLFLVIAARMAQLEVPEIILWNLLTLCGILYFAQGAGILQFFLAKPTISPFLKLLLSALFIVFLLSPVLNVVLIGGLVLLGIAENWAPFRAPKSNGPPSTPEAGNDGGAQ